MRAAGLNVPDSFTNFTLLQFPSASAAPRAAMSGRVGPARARLPEGPPAGPPAGPPGSNLAIQIVDADTDAFNEIMAAFGLPQTTEGEKAAGRFAGTAH